MLFRNCGTQPALLGNLCPQFGIKTRAILVHQFADAIGRAFGGKEFARLILQRQLLVGKIEIHLRASPNSPCGFYRFFITPFSLSGNKI